MIRDSNKMKKSLTEMSYKLDSHRCLMVIEKDTEYEFCDLLNLYDRADVPAIQEPYFSWWYEAFVKVAPKYDGPGLTLYRGTNQESLDRFGNGISWTTNKDLAIKFAGLSCNMRYLFLGCGGGKTPITIEKYFSPDQIIYSHTNNRGEQEVFIKKESYLGLGVKIRNLDEKN